MMITISYNGEAIQCPDRQQLTELLAQQQATTESKANKPFAVAINGEFIPKSQYANTLIQANDNIDVVSPVTGG